MTNLPAVRHHALPGLPGIEELNTAYKLAERLVGTSFVPRSVSDADTVLAIFMHGGALGLSPTQSLQHISIVEGKPSASAELQRAWVLERGHRIRVVEADRQHATVWGKRHDNGDEQTVTWTVADAAAAGLCTIGDDGYAKARSSRGGAMPWEKHTRNMLIARATTDLCRELFPDVGIGVSYTPDELGGEPDGYDLSHEPTEPARTVEEILAEDIEDAEVVAAVPDDELEPEPTDPHPHDDGPIDDADVVDEDTGMTPAKYRQRIAMRIRDRIGDTEQHRRITLATVTRGGHVRLTPDDEHPDEAPIPDDKLPKALNRILDLTNQQVAEIRAAAVAANDKEN